MVKTPRFKSRESGFNPWFGIPHAMWCGQKKIFFLKEKEIIFLVPSSF